MTLTDQEIAEGLRLAEAATPGPWITNATPLPGSTANGVFTSPPDPEAPEIFVCSVKPRWEQDCAVGDEAIANAEFIAAARTLLPAALTELASTQKLTSWLSLLLRAVRQWDVSWPDRGGVFIGGGHPSKDRTIPCEFDAEGRPIENAELRAAIEGCLDPSPQPTE